MGALVLVALALVSLDAVAQERTVDRRTTVEVLAERAGPRARGVVMLFLRGDYAGALASAEAGAAKSPSAAWAHLAGFVAMKRGAYAEALRLLGDARRLREHTDPQSPLMLELLAHEAELHGYRGDLRAATAALELAQSVDTLAAPNPRARIALLTAAGHVSNLRGDIDEAPARFQQALSLGAEHLAADNPDLALAHTGLGMVSIRRAEYALAQQHLDRALSISAARFGDNSPETVFPLLGLALLELPRGHPAQTDEWLARARPIVARAFDRDSLFAGLVLAVGATSSLLQGKPREAAEVADEALRGMEVSSGPKSLQLGTPLMVVGVARSQLGELRAAAAAFERALRISEGGGQHPRQVALFASKLGGVRRMMGQPHLARDHIERATSLTETTLDKASPELAIHLDELAQLESDTGDFGRAAGLLRRALAIRIDAFGPDHAMVAHTRALLGGAYADLGSFTSAREELERALRIRERLTGDTRYLVGVSLLDLATVRRLTGRSDDAKKLAGRALELLEATLGPGHAEVAGALNQLGLLSAEAADDDAAKRYYQRAMAIHKEVHRDDHPAVAAVLHNLASIAHDQADDVGAESLYRQALRIEEHAYGTDHPRVAATLNNLGVLYSDMGKFDAARALHERALAMRERTYGDAHPTVETSLINLAALYESKGDMRRAIDYQQRAMEVAERVLTATLAGGSARDKRAYFDSLSGALWSTISLHVLSAPADPKALELALTTILRRKGRTLDAEAATLRALRVRAAPEDQRRIDELARARAELAVLMLRGPHEGMKPTAHAARMAVLREQSEALESALAVRNASVRIASLPVSGDSIKRLVPAAAALIEIAAYRAWSPRSRRKSERFGVLRYAAYVLRGDAPPGFVDLGEAKPIDELARKLRRVIDGRQAGASRALLRELHDRVMGPIRPLLGRSRDLFVSADGELQLVPLAALVDEDDRHLVERYRVTNLTSGRDMLRWSVRAPAGSAAIIVAEPDYGPAAESSGSNKGGLLFRALDAHQELAALRPSLGSATILRGSKATEANVKAAHGPELLHISTHGFFLPAAAQGEDLLEGALARSGLALAGANTRGGTDEDDGVLSALEVASMDLLGTRLVTLSACETGLGTHTNADGVYGLRRAFVLAGSETQVMSLWRVEERASARLMADYYRRLVRGEGRSEALRQTQLGLLADPNTAHPYYWAAFQVQGDPRSLDGVASSDVKPMAVKRGARGCHCAHVGGGRLSADRVGWMALVIAVGIRRRMRARAPRALMHSSPALRCGLARSAGPS